MFIDSYDLIRYYDVLCLILAFILYFFFFNLTDIISVFRWIKEQITMWKVTWQNCWKGNFTTNIDIWSLWNPISSIRNWCWCLISNLVVGRFSLLYYGCSCGLIRCSVFLISSRSRKIVCDMVYYHSKLIFFCNFS